MGIMNFTYYPFGNAYVKISECSLDPGFSCWENKCGYTASNPPSDCYTGEVVCQHGNGECYGNLVETCVKNMTNNDASKYMPFVYCFEANGDASEKLMEECAPLFGLNVPAINACVNGQAGKTLTAADAKATAMVPNRNYVPYIVVNGKVLQETSLLLYTVCHDWQGTKPPGCKL
eukprot:TRINITY_DN565_c0_g1_i1.p1 TRINITY_DN565_c0_g1~~TRINITY_DN565_c0_g1_i1.p1  ORF type:complete len:175 (+),score=73.22 TRINITY_DN565_c0_g1_i1:2226-2750(+)